MTVEKLSHPNCIKRYTRFKKVAMLNAKEYMDKMVTFSHNGSVYMYSASIQSIPVEDYPREFAKES